MESKQLELFPQEPADSSAKTTQNNQEFEWCFQFFDNEPVVFAWPQNEDEAGDLILTLNPNEDSSIVFNDNGMTFRLFSRPISESTKVLRQNKKQELQENENKS